MKRLQAVLPEPVRQAEAGEDPRAMAAQQQVAQLTQALQQLAAQFQAAQADKGRDERKLDIDAYRAVTDRLASVSEMVTPEMVQAMVVETLRDAQQTAERVPEGARPPGMAPEMAGAPQG